FGSYSIATTRAGTPSLLRLKSMIRYFCLCPPPRRRVVMRPWWLRPPDLLIVSVSPFSGPFRVISVKVLVSRKRVPAVIGFNCLIDMASDPLEDLDRIARLQGHHGLLPGGAPPDMTTHTALLAPISHGANFTDLHREELLDRPGDLHLVRLF